MQKNVYEFISKQTNDPIVEWKICKVSGTQFPIYQSDLEFYDKISPTFNGVKYQIPTPTLCPEERQRRRSLFRNERKLYNRICDASGKPIISIFSPNSGYTVYDRSFWMSDARDPMEYGRAYDFTKTFTQQFGELLQEIPHSNLMALENENSQYVNYVWYCNNCYLLFEAGFAENVYYANMIQHSDFLVDCTHIDASQHCYQCVDIKNCYNMMFCVNCKDCHDCFGCTDLQGKQFYINNIAYDKETYETKTKALLMEGKADFFDIGIKNGNQILNSEDCTGGVIDHSKHCNICFDVNRSQNLKYAVSIDEEYQDSCDIANCAKGSLTYEGSSNAGQNLLFSRIVPNGQNILYSYGCFYPIENCFGCTGIKTKQYCILNKQYTKEEYEQLVPKIIENMIKDGEWGEFLDPILSPHGYNETLAQEQFPLTRDEALKRGYKWMDQEYPINVPENAQTINAKDLPINIQEVTDDILNKVIVCEETGKPFRIIKQELDFYRKHTIPLPKKHPDIRHQERSKLRPKRELHLRICDKCQTEILSVYDRDFTGKVYCEACYNKEIYG